MSGVTESWFWYKFIGEAANPDPPIVQFLIALLAVS